MPKPENAITRISRPSEGEPRSERELQFQIGCFSLKPRLLKSGLLRVKAFNFLIGCIWPVICTFAVVSTLFASLGQFGAESMLLDLLRAEARPNAENEPAQFLEATPGGWLAVLGSVEAGAPEAEIPAKPRQERSLTIRERPRKEDREFGPPIILAQPALPIAVAEPEPPEIEFTTAPAPAEGLLDELAAEAGIAPAAPEHTPGKEGPLAVPVDAMEVHEAPKVYSKSPPESHPEAAPDAPAETAAEEEVSVRDNRPEVCVGRDEYPRGPIPPSPPESPEAALRALAESSHVPDVPTHRDPLPAAPQIVGREQVRRAIPGRPFIEGARPVEKPEKQSAPVLGVRIRQEPESRNEPVDSPRRQPKPAGHTIPVRAEINREPRRSESLDDTERRIPGPRAAAVEPGAEPQAEPPAKAGHQRDAVSRPEKTERAAGREAPTTERASGPAASEPKVEALLQATPPARPVKADGDQPAQVERPAPPPSIEERKPAPGPQPVIRVKLDVPEAEPVHVQFVQRAGEVHVLVRSDEPGASARLASRIDDLAHDLHSNGAEAESWAAYDEVPETQREESASQPAVLTGGHSAEARDQSTGERRGPRPLPEWLEMLAEREDEAALRRFRRLNEKEESAWRQ